MLISTSRLRTDAMDDYTRLLQGCSGALIYHTPQYLAFLLELIPQSELVVLAAYKDNELVAAFPLVAADRARGRILNSLPYFGSHGDLLIADAVDDKESLAQALYDQLDVLLREGTFAAINIVAHPTAGMAEAGARRLGLEPWDARTSQITPLGSARTLKEAEELLLASCRQKTRNLVRKGLKAGFEIAVDDSQTAWSEMQRHHAEGMLRIGGRAKSVREFECLKSALKPDQHRLYVARKNGRFAGALLNLYHRDWVEYFTPVSVEEFRSEQVLSALIASAMTDAILEGRRYWNWGGTWASQSGVHHFKQGWGAIDRTYLYWGKVCDAESPLNILDPSILSEEYRYLYVRPFRRDV